MDSARNEKKSKKERIIENIEKQVQNSVEALKKLEKKLEGLNTSKDFNK